MWRRGAQWLLCIASMAALAGCADRTGWRLWAASDMLALTDRTPPSDFGEVWDGQTRTVRLVSAANEVVSFQLVVDAPPEGLKAVRIETGPLTTAEGLPLPGRGMVAYRMLPVPITRFPAWYLRLAEAPVRPHLLYDALAPMQTGPRGGSIDLAGGERLAVWIDIEVPPNAVPAEYHGRATVRHAGGARDLKVVLKVCDFVLPEARPVVCVGGFSHKAIFRQFVRRKDETGRQRPFVPSRLETDNPEVRAGLVIIRQLMRLAHEHRLDLFDKDLHPLLKRDRDGNVVLRWEDYDAIVKPYLDGSAFDDRIGVPTWPAPLWAGWPDPTNYGGSQTAAYRVTFRAVANQVARHFEQLGAARKLFFWPRPTASGPEGYTVHAALAGMFRVSAPDVPILSTLPLQPPPETTWKVPEDFPALVDLAAPPGDLAGLSRAAGWSGRLKDSPLAGMWLRPGAAPYVGTCGVLAAPADVRALPWLAMKYHCKGVFIPEVLNWRAETPGPAAEGANRLFYPGSRFGLKTVLASVRLKWLRRGMQDVAYLWLLQRRQRGAIARAMTDMLVRYAGLDATGDHYQDVRLDGWVRDGEAWVAARRILAREILAAIHPDRLTARDELAQEVRWKQLTRRVCRLRVERIRTALAPAPAGRHRATVRVELFNEFTRPIDAELRLGPMPPGWKSAEPTKTLKDLPPGRRTMVELTALGQALPTGREGKVKFPLSVRAEIGPAQQLVVELPVVLAGWTYHRPIIDGDLRDWPLRPGNTAAGFKLLGRRGRIGTGRAGRQTAVFALHDDENLYLAFRCQEPRPERLFARPSNIVRYDQLMACGEDLVEVVIDPTGKAQNIDQLYHLLIKCNGAVITERGIRADPPVGRARPWPAAVKAAIGRYKDHWTVELAIPLSAFQQRSAGGYWRVNFTRFATADAEASSWSGAVRYFYDPGSLGTMILLPPAAGPRPASAPASR